MDTESSTAQCECGGGKIYFIADMELEHFDIQVQIEVSIIIQLLAAKNNKKHHFSTNDPCCFTLLLLEFAAV